MPSGDTGSGPSSVHGTGLSSLLSGDGTLRLHGGDADGTFEWLLREGTEWATTEEVQSVVSLPAEPGVPVGRSSAASGEGEPFHWRCLDSTHQLACIRFVTRCAWVTGRSLLTPVDHRCTPPPPLDRAEEYILANDSSAEPVRLGARPPSGEKRLR